MLLNFFRHETDLNERGTSGGNFDKGHVVHLRGQWMFFFRGRVRDSSNCRGCLVRRRLQRVPSRASRVCIKEGAGTANGSQESSKGGWNSFRPCPTSAGHADNKAPTALSRLVFFPPLPTFPIPLGVEWKLENGSSVSGIPDSKFHEGEEEEEEGIGNDVSPKVTDQPEFCRFLWISCVSAAKKFCSSKRNDYPSNPRFIIFLEIDKIFLDQCGTTVWTIIVPKLIVVNWCARMKSFPLRVARSMVPLPIFSHFATRSALYIFDYDLVNF